MILSSRMWALSAGLVGLVVVKSDLHVKGNWNDNGGTVHITQSIAQYIGILRARMYARPIAEEFDPEFAS
jgi:hypothetical protein